MRRSRSLLTTALSLLVSSFGSAASTSMAPTSELRQALAPTGKLRVGVRSLIKRGKLRRGVHYVRPSGLSTRFKESAIKNWLDEREEKNTESEASIKMVKGYRMK